MFLWDLDSEWVEEKSTQYSGSLSFCPRNIESTSHPLTLSRSLNTNILIIFYFLVDAEIRPGIQVLTLNLMSARSNLHASTTRKKKKKSKYKCSMEVELWKWSGGYEKLGKIWFFV